MIDLSKMCKKSDIEYFPLLPTPKPPEFGQQNGSNLSYKDAVNQAMTDLGNEGAIFIGYNVKFGNAMGTLKNVSDDQKVETPVAENLMSGLAIGMSFEGLRPVLYFERHDFMLVAADAIDLAKQMGA